MAGLIGFDSTNSGFHPELEQPAITFGVWGDSGGADGVIGSTATGVGVFGRSTDANGTGVEAASTAGIALHARRDPGGGAAVTEAFLATPGLAADFRGDVATTGAVRVGGRLDAAGVVGSSNTGVGVVGRSSENGTGVQATSTGGTALHARCGGAPVTEALLATPSLAADFRGDVATTGALRVRGRLAAGSTAPRAAVGIRGVNATEDLLSFEDSSGTTRWHVNQKLAGRSGLNFAETNVADGDGRLYLQAGGNVGVGTTAPTHPLHVAKVRGIRQNELYLSGGKGGSSLSYNAYRNDATTNWVFPDPSRHAVKVEMDDQGGNPRFEVHSTTLGNPTTWDLHLAVGPGFVEIPDGQLKVFNSRPDAGSNSGSAVHATSRKGTAIFAEGGGPGSAALLAAGNSTFVGNVHVLGAMHVDSGITTGPGLQSLVDSPCDPENKTLTHACVESDERFNVYSGNIVLDDNGEARVTLPRWVGAFNRDFRYQLTCIGQAALVYVAQEVSDDAFSIAGGTAGMTVSWQLTGVRNDAWAQANPHVVEQEKPDDEKGFFLNPEVFGHELTRGIHHKR